MVKLNTLKGLLIEKNGKLMVSFKHNQMQTWSNEIEVLNINELTFQNLNKEINFEMKQIPIGNSNYKTYAVIL